MFPARAGMSPRRRGLHLARMGVPRASGDEPPGGSSIGDRSGVPRASGDEPRIPEEQRRHIRCSPRERG